jgi:2'-5' RNA ligase
VNDERARLFVALELPGEVRSSLAEWCADVLDRRDGLRRVGTDALHVTLCFLGWRTVGEIDAIDASCEPARACAVAALRVGEAVWLPARRPRVLAVSLADDDGALGRVQSVLSESLQAGGWYLPETRPFFGHVTVARVDKGPRPPHAPHAPHAARMTRVPRGSREELPAPPRLEFRASTVTLFRSRLGGAGARYEPLRRFELGSSEVVLDPVSVVRRFHAEQARAYAGGALDPLRELISDDVVWHVPGHSRIAGEHRGVDAVLAYFDERRRLTDETFRVTVHGAALIGERIVQLAGGRATRGGRELEWETVGVFRVADGRVAECWLVPFDVNAFDEIWS